MNKKITRSLLVFPALLLVTGCNNSATTETTTEPPFVPEEINFERIKNVANEGFYLEPGEERTVDINYESLDKNYVRLDVLCDVDVYGTFNYLNVDKPSETGRESFFIKASDEVQQFTQFFDAYRPKWNDHVNCSPNGGAHKFYDIPMKTKMAQGAFDKEITTITIKNVSPVAGNVELRGLYLSDRELPKEEVYLQKGFLKIGTDLMGGGTFTYLERLNYQTSKGTYNIDEIMTADGDIYIGVDAENMISDGGQLGSEDHHVNLINYYDSGRQLQQSFYAAVGGSHEATAGENGYTRKYCYTGSSNGTYWPYNPVQGGDCHCNISQLIDFKITEDTIYIKAKPLDWADNNCVTDSYMENWYSIIGENVFVKNRFVDFNGFVDMEKVNATQLELPATYFDQPLHTYVTYQGETPWTDDQSGLDFNPNLGPWNITADIVNHHPEDWFAWVNDDRFGVGMYIPDIDYYASGRASVSTNASYRGNMDAYSSPMGNSDLLRYNKKECEYPYQSCYVTNTCYTAPEIRTRMLEYIPFEYTYALCVDYIPIIRNSFRNLYRKNAIDNKSMFIWEDTIAEMNL